MTFNIHRYSHFKCKLWSKSWQTVRPAIFSQWLVPSSKKTAGTQKWGGKKKTKKPTLKWRKFPRRRTSKPYTDPKCEDRLWNFKPVQGKQGISFTVEFHSYETAEQTHLTLFSVHLTAQPHRSFIFFPLTGMRWLVRRPNMTASTEVCSGVSL